MAISLPRQERISGSDKLDAYRCMGIFPARSWYNRLPPRYFAEVLQQAHE